MQQTDIKIDNVSEKDTPSKKYIEISDETAQVLDAMKTLDVFQTQFSEWINHTWHDSEMQHEFNKKIFEMVNWCQIQICGLIKERLDSSGWELI